MNWKRLSASMAAACVIAAAANAQTANVPLSYYTSLNGLSGAELKTAAHKLLRSNLSTYAYGSGANHTWDAFYTTDQNPDGSVVDRYSSEVRYFGEKGAAVSGMNIEHSFPKSWWGGKENSAYKDIFNLMPSDITANSKKSNYAMGEVTNVTYDNGAIKIGNGLWEPYDNWKGDFARSYMYMATAYQDFTWTTTQGLSILEDGDYPTLRPEASALYISWARADDVSEMETDRNDAVQSIQGNRNPFVDFPNFMEYIWGDSVGVAFNIYTTRKPFAPQEQPTEPEQPDEPDPDQPDEPDPEDPVEPEQPTGQQEATVVFAQLGYANQAELVQVDANAQLTLIFKQGSGSASPKYFSSGGAAARLYANNTLTISSTGGDIHLVRFATVSSNPFHAESTADSGTFAKETTEATWTGTAPSVTFTQGGTSGHVRIVSVTVVYGDDPEVLMGDANGDGTVSIADAVMTVNHMMGNAPAGFNATAADMNGDSTISISDVVAIVGLMLAQ